MAPTLNPFPGRETSLLKRPPEAITQRQVNARLDDAQRAGEARRPEDDALPPAGAWPRRDRRRDPGPRRLPAIFEQLVYQVFGQSTRVNFVIRTSLPRPNELQLLKNALSRHHPDAVLDRQPWSGYETAVLHHFRQVTMRGKNPQYDEPGIRQDRGLRLDRNIDRPKPEQVALVFSEDRRSLRELHIAEATTISGNWESSAWRKVPQLANFILVGQTAETTGNRRGWTFPGPR